MDDLDTFGLPNSIDIRLLGTCNLSCSFCFGPRHHIRATRFDEICNLIPILRSCGVSRLILTGGEPLLVRRLPELLLRAHDQGFRIVLSTNGSLLPSRHAQIVPYLNWIALPLDGPSASVHDALRPGKRSSFCDVQVALLLLRRLYPDVKIKLGTVVQPGNIGTVASIPKLLTDWGIRPDVWKLYQVSFSNYAADNRMALDLSEQLFEDEIASARTAAQSLNWRTVVYRNNTRDGQYLFLEPSGDAMAISNGEEFTIGNFLDDLSSVLRRWHEYVSDARLDRNADLTYS